MALTTRQSHDNPLNDLISNEGATYLGKYGAAKGPEAKEVSVKTGDGDMDDAVQIMGSDGVELASIPYSELYSFCVITGEGKRKPAISFEHKPNVKSKSGTTHVRTPSVLPHDDAHLHRGQLTRVLVSGPQKVWMEAQLASKCAEDLMGMLKNLEASKQVE